MLLKSDPSANKEFNELLSRVTNPVQVNAAVLESLQKSETNLQAALDQNTRLLKTKDKQQRLIRLLGAVMEDQVDFKPYNEDVTTGRKYNIKFDANQIRMVLRIYWDLVAAEMEAKITTAFSPGTQDEEE